MQIYCVTHFLLRKLKVRVLAGKRRTDIGLVLPEQLVSADEGSAAQAGCAGWCYSSKVLSN